MVRMTRLFILRIYVDVWTQINEKQVKQKTKKSKLIDSDKLLPVLNYLNY